MNRIAELIRQHCPNGVERVKLGEVATQYVEPVRVEPNDTYVNIGVKWYGEGAFARESKLGNEIKAATLYRVKPGQFIYNRMFVTEGSFGLVTEDLKDGVVSNEFPVFDLDPARVIPDWLLLKFQVPSTVRSIAANATGGTKSRRRWKENQFESYVVDLPPLLVQREIVRIIGTFSALNSALEAEWDARKRQLAHYRDALLSFGNADCEWLTLRDVAIDFGRGKSKFRPRNDPKLYGGQYPFVQTGDVRNSGHLITEYSQTYNEVGLAQSKLWPRGTICITIAANIAETGILDFDACFPDSVIGMVVNPKKTSQHYVEYLLQSLKANLAKKGRGSAQANINLATFENERFPFPPLQEQERIVAILDKLDTLANDPKIGIPAELNARRKQYEYYRDRLLTFEGITV